MQKSTRTFLFFLFLSLFLILAPTVIIYSQGYRIDWNQKTIVQTGALFFEPRPAPVEIFIDGRLRKKSNFVFQNVFIGNLLPGNYLVQVKKEGYSAWTKNLEISPKLVTEAKNVMLFPTPPGVVEIKKDIKKFSFSPSRKLIAFVEEDRIPMMTLHDKENNRNKLIFKASRNLANSNITNIQWDKDSTKLFFSLESAYYKEWMMVDITADQPETLPLSKKIKTEQTFKKYTKRLYKPLIDKLAWSQSKPSVIFFTVQETNPPLNRLSTNILFSYDTKNKKLSEPLAYDVLEYAEDDKKIFYMSSILRNLNFLDLETDNVKQISFNPLSNSNNNIEKILADGEKILVIVNDSPKITKSVYYYRKATQSFEKISGNIKNVTVSGDNKKILLLNNQKIEVYWLEDVHVQPFRDKGDVENIHESDDIILSAAWFSKDNEHIIFSTNSGVKIIELDGRDERNIHTLSDRAAEDIYYDEDSENLYILSGKNFYSISLK